MKFVFHLCLCLSCRNKNTAQNHLWRDVLLDAFYCFLEKKGEVNLNVVEDKMW